MEADHCGLCCMETGEWAQDSTLRNYCIHCGLFQVAAPKHDSHNHTVNYEKGAEPLMQVPINPTRV